MITIDDKTLCWCGSGNQYVDCCKSLVSSPNFELSYSDIDKNMELNNYNEALRYSRANLTRYLILVKSHTVPFMHIGNQGIKGLIEVDINALSEIINNMMKVIRIGSLKVDFEKTLKRTKDLFFNAKWHKRVDYYYVAYRYLVLNDRKSAIEYIDNNVTIYDVDDVDFLEMYYDLCSDRLTFSEQIDFLEKLISKEKLVGKIHYKSVLGLNYFWIGDVNKAVAMHAEALEIYENNKEKLTSDYAIYIVSQAYSYYGRLANDDGANNRSLEMYQQLIALDNYSKPGLSHIYWLAGMSYIDIHDYENALKYFSLSDQVMPNNMSKVFSASVLMELEDYDRAQKTIDLVNYKTLPEEDRIDYLLIYGKLLAHKMDRRKMEFVVSELKKLNDKEYYNLIAKSTIITLLELYNNPLEAEQKSSKVMQLLKTINEFLVLKPSIVGFGIDLNKVINKYVLKKD